MSGVVPIWRNCIGLAPGSWSTRWLVARMMGLAKRVLYNALYIMCNKITILVVAMVVSDVGAAACQRRGGACPS